MKNLKDGLLYFKSLDTYKLWYEQKIKEGYKELEEVKKQVNYLDISFRKDMRFGGMYHQWESFKKYIDTNTKGDTTRNFVLIPANEYFSSIIRKLPLLNHLWCIF